MQQLANVNDRSVTPRVAVRLISNPSYPRTTESEWRHLFPHDLMEWTGRMPSQTAIGFLSQMRLNPKKEVFALGFSLIPGESGGDEGRVFSSLIDDYVARE